MGLQLNLVCITPIRNGIRISSSFRQIHKREDFKDALESAEIKHKQGTPISTGIAQSLVNECTKRQDLVFARRTQSLILHSGLNSISFFANHQVRLFGSNGNFIEANQTFENVSRPDHYTWTATFNAHVKHGKCDEAIQLYDRMQQSGTRPGILSFLSILKACKSIEICRQIHEQIVDNQLQFDIAVGSTLVDVYSKCQSLKEAGKVFTAMPDRNEVTWNAIIGGHAQNKEGEVALIFFKGMLFEGIRPNKITFLGALKACASAHAIEEGRCIHEQILQSGLQHDLAIGNTILSMYSKCGGLEEAFAVFSKLADQSVVSWSVLISGYVQNGRCESALECFEKMHSLAIKPDKVTYLSVLKAFMNVAALEAGRGIHEEIVDNGFQFDIVLGSTLVDMYAKYGSLKEAYNVFENLPRRDIIVWGIMIAGYANQGKGHEALECFESMQNQGIKPSKVIFLGALKACSSICSLVQGRFIHEQMVDNDLLSDIAIGSTLVVMYTKAGSLEEALKVFSDLPRQDVVSWSAMIAGCVQHGKSKLAVECYSNMRENIKPDKLMFSTMLQACGEIGAISQGQHIHEQLVEDGIHSEIVIGSALVDMYSKCGSLLEASKVFDELPNKNVVVWSAMITGCAQVGEAGLAAECFENMKNQGIQPNDVAFLGILTALNRVGLADEGLWYARSMIELDGLNLNLLHITCMVELLSHAGCFKEAEDFIALTVKPDICLWVSLLTACKMHANVELGRKCFEAITCVNPFHSGAYVLMANMYYNAYKEGHAYERQFHKYE